MFSGFIKIGQKKLFIVRQEKKLFVTELEALDFPSKIIFKFRFKSKQSFKTYSLNLPNNEYACVTTSILLFDV